MLWPEAPTPHPSVFPGDPELEGPLPAPGGRRLTGPSRARSKCRLCAQSLSLEGLKGTRSPRVSRTRSEAFGCFPTHSHPGSCCLLAVLHFIIPSRPSLPSPYSDGGPKTFSGEAGMSAPPAPAGPATHPHCRPTHQV